MKQPKSALAAAAVAATLSMMSAGSSRALVAPDKPSALVTLVSVGADTTACEGFPRFGRRIFPDGTFSDGFEIPAKQVFVVTAVEVSGQGFTPNRRQPIAILVAPSTQPFLTIYDQVDALGFVGAYQAISPVAVQSGAVLCLDIPGGLTVARLHGFLAKDR
jgi:hypothetical protein